MVFNDKYDCYFPYQKHQYGLIFVSQDVFRLFCSVLNDCLEWYSWNSHRVLIKDNFI